jgi:cyclic AMP-dependent transcription factor ATF-4
LKKTIKKESNKEAATRYRLKKLSEKDQLFETKEHLEKENDQMKKKIELVKTEIYYIKHILVQLLFNKGLLTVN